jgi:hypothetical protein
MIATTSDTTLLTSAAATTAHFSTAFRGNAEISGGMQRTSGGTQKFLGERRGLLGECRNFLGEANFLAAVPQETLRRCLLCFRIITTSGMTSVEQNSKEVSEHFG